MSASKKRRPIEHLAGLDDGDRVAEIVTGELIEIEDVHLAAVVADDFHESEDVAEIGRGEGRGLRDLAWGFNDHRRFGHIGHLLLGDHIVDALDGALKDRGLVFPGVRDVVLNDGSDAAGASAHDDDAIGEEDGLLDVVGNNDDALRLEGELALTAGPHAVNFTAETFGGEDVEGAARLIHAEEFGRACEGTGDADALFHAAGEFLGVGLLEAFQTDDVNTACDAILAGSGIQAKPV